MEIVAEVFKELFIVIFGVGFFIIFVGVRMECRSCGEKYYYHQGKPHRCAHKEGDPLPPKEEPEDQPPETAADSDK